MRLTHAVRSGDFRRLALLATAAALLPGACKSPDQRAPEPAERAPAARTAEPAQSAARDGGHRHGSLARPDISADWNWNGQALPTGDVATSVVTIENMGPASVNANAEYDYKIRVKNIAPTAHLADVVVTDHLPASGYAFASATPPAERSGEILTWKLGHLAPGEAREIVIRGRGTTTGSLRECASVAWTPLVCVTTDVVSAALELQKFAPAEVVHCDEIPLRFVVRNPGTGEARNVKVTDQLPDGWTVNGSAALAFDVGTLKGGETRELKAVARASKVGEFVNRATASADGGLKADASAPTTVSKPKLAITKTASSDMEILTRETVFTITVKNAGDCPAKEVVLTDAMTGAERILSVSDGGTISGSAITWKLGNLAVGASRTVTVAATRSTAGSIDDTATATAYCADPVSASASTLYRGVPAVLLELVDSPDPVLVGSTTTYTITVTNQGTAPDSDIAITCYLEDAVEFVSGAGSTPTTKTGATVTFAPLAALAPKAVARWTVTVRGAKAADSRFKVELNTKETGRPVVQSEATRIYE